jgi:hypothetical protein
MAINILPAKKTAAKPASTCSTKKRTTARKPAK